MQILGSDVRLSSAHLFEVRHRVAERVQVTDDPAAFALSRRRGDAHFVRSEHTPDAASRKLIKLVEKFLRRRDDAPRPDETNKRVQRLIERIDRVRAELTAKAADRAEPNQIQVRYERRESFREVEATSLRVAGSVTTADGREIEIGRALELARAFARRETVSLRATIGREPGEPDGDVTTHPVGDPIVVPDPPSPAAEVPRSHRRGLALDGGILAYDHNGDGAFDPETEIVGRNGNGFDVLRELDEDGNGFIDEGDAVYDRLALLDRGEDGLTTTSLEDRGVGAIYTGSVSTPFRFTDAANVTTADLLRSGFYLDEDGSTGFVHQIDVVV